MSESTTPVRDMEIRLARSTGRGGRDKTASARLTEEEHNEIEAAAKRTGESVSEWARQAMLATARRPADDVILTELVVVRLLLLNLVKPIAQGKVLTEEECASISTQIQQNKRRVTKDLEQQYSSRGILKT